MSDRYDVRHYSRDGIEVIVPPAEFDVYSAPRVRELVISAAGEGLHSLVFDLTEVTFVDPPGLGVMVGALKRCRQHSGKCAAASTQEYVLKVLRLTGLDKVLPVCASVDEAVKAIKEQAAVAAGKDGGNG
jgi:anti-sigma B factor antagonist